MFYTHFINDKQIKILSENQRRDTDNVLNLTIDNR